MGIIRTAVLTVVLCSVVNAQNPSYSVPSQFPTSIFDEYYYDASPTREPQPKVYDAASDVTFPLNLTDPSTLPELDTTDPVALPRPIFGHVNPDQAAKYVAGAVAQIHGIIEGEGIQTNCSKCVASLNVLKSLALVTPQSVPDVLISLCQRYQWHANDTCVEDFTVSTAGQVWTQVLAFGDVNGLDGRYICYYLNSYYCTSPPAYPPLNTTGLFPKPKPANAAAPAPSGKRVKVLHLSDLHLDPRYSVASEANCTSGLCCRTDAANSHLSNGSVSLEAPLYGTFKCDTPYFLATAALQSVHPLTGTSNDDSLLGFTIYTGDLVSHEDQRQLSRAYLQYEEASIYHMIHGFINGPVFPTLGNHDSNPEAQDAPHSLPGRLGQQFSWNYKHVSKLWRKNGWLDDSAVKQARVHYGGYSIKTHLGLRIITFNTDFWYHSNIFNYINASNPDVSGSLHWLIDELQAAEDANERVWILGHVLSGWDGSNPMPNPTDLFYQIVERYSPHVIANLFWGHTHEDEIMVYYAANGTNRNSADAATAKPLSSGWIGPSITPLNNLNSGFRMYEVDTGSFDIYEATTYYSDVSSYPSIDTNTEGPSFEYEYSTRQSYGPAANWPADAPLNATFWHAVTVALEDEAAKGGNLTLTQQFNSYQGKLSVKSPKCNTTDCAYAKICYIRSGSAPLGRECTRGYGSVQSAFSPPKPSNGTK